MIVLLDEKCPQATSSQPNSPATPQGHICEVPPPWQPDAPGMYPFVAGASALPGPSPGAAYGRKGPCILKQMGSRPCDLFYVLFFIHFSIPATVVFDLPLVLAALSRWSFIRLGFGDSATTSTGWLQAALGYVGGVYVRWTNDPVVGSVGGYFGEEVRREFGWVKWLMWVEVLFQLPTSIYAAYNLWHNTNIPKVYPLLLAYGVSTALSTLPCIAVIFSAPSMAVSQTTPSLGLSSNNSTSLAGSGEPLVLTMGLTTMQRAFLLVSYTPFFLIPLFMAVDIGRRLHKLAHVGWAIKTSKID